MSIKELQNNETIPSQKFNIMTSESKMLVDCKLCGKTFSTQSTANRHVRKVHNMKTEAVYEKGVWSYQCLEYNCESSFQHAKYLISHLEDKHGLKFETVVMTIASMEEFFRWKSSVEVKSNCRYIFRTRYKTLTGESIYYNCNRSKTSYIPKSDDQRKRSQKSQGSCKLGHSCTSQIKVTKEDDFILVQWQKVHYGHDFELQHIRLPNQVRKKIYSKLNKGDTPKMILQTTRQKIKERHLNRIDLLTAKDISNIKNSFKIKSVDDHTYANEESSDSESLETVYLGKVHEEDPTNELSDTEIQEDDQMDPFTYQEALSMSDTEINGYEDQITKNVVSMNEEVNDTFSGSEYTEESQTITSENEYIEGQHEMEGLSEAEEGPSEVAEEPLKVSATDEHSNEEDGSSILKEEIFIHIIQDENRKTENDSLMVHNYIESDLEDPVKRRKYWIESQKAIKHYDRENSNLIKSNDQMLRTIDRLHDLVTELKNQVKNKTDEKKTTKRKRKSKI